MEISIRQQYAISKPTQFRFFKLSFFNTQQNQNWYKISEIQISEFNFFDSNMAKFQFPDTMKIVEHHMTPCKEEETFDNLFDNNLNTKWCSVDDQTLIWYGIMDLGENKTIDISTFSKFGWFNANDTTTYTHRRIFKMKLEFSNDKQHWIVGADIDNLDTTAENFKLAYVGDINMIQSS